MESSKLTDLDLISRCDAPEPIRIRSQDLKLDEHFFGFHGLNQDTLYLYRVLGASESISNEIVCKDPNSSRTVEQHIASGSTYGSRFISTTRNRKVAALWAFYEMETSERKPRDEPLRIVEIRVKKLIGTKTEKECINLCNKEVREHFIKGAIHRNWAISSQEVLFQKSIPEYVQPQHSPHPKQGGGIPLLLKVFENDSDDDARDAFENDSDDDDDDDDDDGGDRAYYLAKDVPKPEQPPAKKPKSKIVEGMANLKLVQ